MALVPVDAVLWRSLANANYDTLAGLSSGQYHITLGTNPEVDRFFEGLPRINKTSLGGYGISVPMAPLDGPNSVAAMPLQVKFMGPKASRPNDWNIPAQRPNTAYPLWRLDRTQPNRTLRNQIVIVRDINGAYHARWLHPAARQVLPTDLKNRIDSADFGIEFMEPKQTAADADRIADKLFANHNVLLYGPPGTGKSQLMWQVAKVFGGDPLQIDTADENIPLKGGAARKEPIVRWMTFHQSLGYEDFIVGLRPDPSSGQALSLRAYPGVLLELAEAARITGRPAILLIDEINRGNVSRIFGEFITLLEPDKRLDMDGKKTATTISLSLPYVDADTVVSVEGKDCPVSNPFTLPANIYVLASMNSVDRSVAPLDAALRRRFRIVNVDPDVASLHLAFAQHPPTGSAEDVAEVNRIRTLAADLLIRLNEGISAFRGPDYQLGQWYFADMLKAASPAMVRAALVGIWQEKLQPHLEDVFHGRAEQLAALIGDDGPVQLSSPLPHYESVGARPFLSRRSFSTDETLAFLEALAPATISTARLALTGVPVSSAAD